MGLVYANIELTNVYDLALCDSGYLSADNIRKVSIRALVDSGAYLMCLNELVVYELGLKRIDSAVTELADGTMKVVDVAGPVIVKFKNRQTVCNVAVIPGDSENLLGTIPMEGMDVVIDPMEQLLKLPDDRPYLAKTWMK